MAKAELFNPVIGPPLRALGGFRVERSNSEDGIATAIRLVRAGEVVAMFPQGTRVQKGLRKRIQPRGRTGAARIALEARVPLVPAAIKGTDRLLRLGRMGVAYGEPIMLDDLCDLEPKEAAEAATERLMDALAELMRSL
jgi:1-acyl-sn-glycerol-3-phosphate acyltransferase